MKTKILNLRDALHLASILEKYLDEEAVAKGNAIDFISALVGKLSPMEYLHCVMLLTGEAEERIKNEESVEILTVFINGIKENQILSLVPFYYSLGFKKCL